MSLRATGATEEETNGLLAVHVFVTVTPGENDAAAFQAASVANASASILEAGIARFDALRKVTDSKYPPPHTSKSTSTLCTPNDNRLAVPVQERMV